MLFVYAIVIIFRLVVRCVLLHCIATTLHSLLGKVCSVLMTSPCVVNYSDNKIHANLSCVEIALYLSI